MGVHVKFYEQDLGFEVETGSDEDGASAWIVCDVYKGEEKVRIGDIVTKIGAHEFSQEDVNCWGTKTLINVRQLMERHKIKSLNKRQEVVIAFKRQNPLQVGTKGTVLGK